MPKVYAVGIATSHGLTGDDRVQALKLQRAMSEAANQAQREGLDEEQTRARIMAARDAALRS